MQGVAVAVVGGDAVAVVHHDELAADRSEPGGRDSSGTGGVHGCADGNGDVYAFVELAGAQDRMRSVAESTRHPGRGRHGPGEVQRGGQGENVPYVLLRLSGVVVREEAGVGGQTPWVGETGCTGPANGAFADGVWNRPSFEGAFGMVGFERLELGEGVGSELAGDGDLEPCGPRTSWLCRWWSAGGCGHGGYDAVG